MTGKSGCVHVIFDDMVRFLESFFDIAIIRVGIIDVAFLGGIVASSHSESAYRRPLPAGVAGRMTGASGARPLRRSTTKGMFFPFHDERPQCLFADVLTFSYDDSAYFGAFLVGLIVQKSLSRSHKETAVTTAGQVLDVLVFPGDDVDDSGDGSGFRGVDLFDARVCIGASEKLGVEHVWNDIVDAEFCYAGCLRPGQYSRKVRFPDNSEIFSCSVYSCQVCHSMYILSFAPNDRGIAIDADLRYLSGFILEQFSAGNKAIEEENPQN